jgi:hypothetical protein
MSRSGRRRCHRGRAQAPSEFWDGALAIARRALNDRDASGRSRDIRVQQNAAGGADGDAPWPSRRRVRSRNPPPRGHHRIGQRARSNACANAASEAPAAVRKGLDDFDQPGLEPGHERGSRHLGVRPDAPPRSRDERRDSRRGSNPGGESERARIQRARGRKRPILSAACAQNHARGSTGVWARRNPSQDPRLARTEKHRVRMQSNRTGRHRPAFVDRRRGVLPQ